MPKKIVLNKTLEDLQPYIANSPKETILSFQSKKLKSQLILKTDEK